MTRSSSSVGGSSAPSGPSSTTLKRCDSFIQFVSFSFQLGNNCLSIQRGLLHVQIPGQCTRVPCNSPLRPYAGRPVCVPCRISCFAGWAVSSSSTSGTNAGVDCCAALPSPVPRTGEPSSSPKWLRLRWQPIAEIHAGSRRSLPSPSGCS